VRDITASELAALGETATIIDVREQGEYDQAHVAGSTLIPMSQFVERQGEVPKDTTVYLLCATGNRSGRVTEYLEQQGYDAVNVAGGITAWQGIGQGVERG
jgi:rhodanese-related sulfurtransferase